MQKNVLFRGCTRPAMFLGVPYVPFFIFVGGWFIISLYTKFWLLFFLPVIVMVLRQMAKRDEMIFRLLGLNLRFRLKARNMRQHKGMMVFSPHQYRKSPAGAKRDVKGPFIISGRMTGPAVKAAPVASVKVK